MDQQKMGEFLKRLRKEKGLTQEQLAERFYVSSRTVSRWETGKNLPDVVTLVDLADFYDVDIREIIDGERRSEMMDKETKDTLKKVAVYAEEKEKKNLSQILVKSCVVAVLVGACLLLFMPTEADVNSTELLDLLSVLVYITIMAFIGGFLMFCVRTWWAWEAPTKEPEKTVAATLVSKEVHKGVKQTGRSMMGYDFLLYFRTASGEELKLYAYEIEWGGLKEGMTGELTYQGRYYVNLQENP